jgi:hypothetical protein
MFYPLDIFEWMITARSLESFNITIEGEKMMETPL